MTFFTWALKMIPELQPYFIALGATGSFLIGSYVWGARVFRRIWPGREKWGADGIMLDQLTLSSRLPTGQVVSQQVSNPASNAYTGGIASRWTTYAPQAPGMWFRLDLGQIAIVTRIEFDHGRSFEDYPEEWAMEVSPDGTNWIMFKGAGRIDRQLSPRSIRFIKVTITRPHGGREGHPSPYWWSIHDIRIHQERLAGYWTAII